MMKLFFRAILEQNLLVDDSNPRPINFAFKLKNLKHFSEKINFAIFYKY